MSDQKIFSVSELTACIKKMLEQRYPFISVAGEITNLRRPGSGHCYFTLKDDQAQIKAVLFKMQQRYLEKQPQDGQMVVCQGRISLYEPRGDYQIIVDAMDFHGAGALQLAFEQLKNKLAGEGLFAREQTKDIPLFPTHLTLVTSPTGAAVHDFIRIASKRYPQIKIAVYPVPVQGDAAPGEISRAIADINQHLKTDLIVLTRGGGSIEDLWAFNDEQLARTIFASKLPVVSAVGHEIDFTIADFVADLRAPTPSGAAEMILPDSAALANRVYELSHRISQTVAARLAGYEQQLKLYRQHLAHATRPIDNLMLRLDHYGEKITHAMQTMLLQKTGKLGEYENRLQNNSPALYIGQYQVKTEEIQRRINDGMLQILARKEQQLIRSGGLLDAVSPLATLARGYAIARKKSGRKTVISRETQVRRGEAIEVVLAEGKLNCLVQEKTISRSG
jgi:exodeoxyribonuclease VII large subunit